MEYGDKAAGILASGCRGPSGETRNPRAASQIFCLPKRKHQRGRSIAYDIIPVQRIKGANPVIALSVRLFADTSEREAHPPRSPVVTVATNEFEAGWGAFASVNDRSRRRSLFATRGLRLGIAFAAVALPLHAFAQLNGRAAGTLQYENNSNVFDLTSGFGTPTTATGRRSDTYYAYGAEFDAQYGWRRQEFYAEASASRYDYQHFSDLDHTGYNFDGGLRWKLAGLWDGRFDVSRTRNMVPFYNLSGNLVGPQSLTLSIMTEQRETAEVGMKLTSVWKLQGSAFTSKTDQPIVGSPNLQLNQKSGTLALNYLGLGGLTSGLSATYLSGDYQGSNNSQFNASFDQTTFGVVAKYKHTRTTFDGQFGYSRRTSGNALDNTSGLTGLIDFTDQLTPRTSLTLKADRLINNYVLNSGSEIDSDLGGGLQWQATYKSAFTVSYTFSYRDFPGQGNNPVGSRRVDIQEYVTFGVTYEPRKWLLIKPYYNAQTRRSTFVGGHFSGTVWGVNLVVQTSDKRK
jgi:hypothetical protein